MARANQIRFAGLAVALVLAAPPPLCGQARAAEIELAVKATYLVKFAPFVTWPTAAANGPLKVCVQGKDPFGQLLERAVAGQMFRDRAVVLAHVERLEPFTDCDIAYLGGTAAQSPGDALNAVKTSPVLTVSDGDAPGAVPAIVQLKTVDGRVRFIVDLVLARRAGLEINSKLLALAVSVKK